MTDDIKTAVKNVILTEFLPGEDPAELTDSTPLITGGILDSIATLRLVMLIEERYGITLQAYEVDPEHLDTISLIAELIRSKQSS
jgi:acyl carrier protein